MIFLGIVAWPYCPSGRKLVTVGVPVVHADSGIALVVWWRRWLYLSLASLMAYSQYSAGRREVCSADLALSQSVRLILSAIAFSSGVCAVVGSGMMPLSS